MEECSVTRAETRIGRTQPAVSAALLRFRALAGDELFVRGLSGLQPTPRALDLAEPLGRVLADIQRTLAFTQAFDPGLRDGRSIKGRRVQRSLRAANTRMP